MNAEQLLVKIQLIIFDDCTAEQKLASIKELLN